jgi:putative transposase
LIGERSRYRLLSMPDVLTAYGAASIADFRTRYIATIDGHIESRRLSREARWTESIAVGSESFVRAVESETGHRVRLSVEHVEADAWTIREVATPYDRFLEPKNAPKELWGGSARG